MGIANFSGSQGLTIASPGSWWTTQRSGTTGSIAISGNVGTGTHTIEARFNGGAWTSIAASATTTFSGTLTSQAQGQGQLQVRWQDDVTQIASTSWVGIGDVYAIAGESNASGRSPTLQYYDFNQTMPLRPALFGNDYNYQPLTDATDSMVSQVDAVSKESVGNPASGSIWPLLATSYIVRTATVPIMFIPCPLGGTRISQWQPGASHTDRTTLYGSCVFRIQSQPNSVKAVLMWLGENDMNAGTTQTAFATGLQSFSDAIFADTGATTVVPLNLTLPAGSLVSGTEQAAINAAISGSWGTHHILAGPDLTVITCDSGDFFHIYASSLLQQAATLWQTALNTAFGL